MKGRGKGKGYEGKGMKNSNYEDSHKTRQWSPTSNKGGMTLAKSKNNKSGGGIQNH